MKLSASIDLAPKKAALKTEIDAYFNRQIQLSASSVPVIHELKSRIAAAVQAGSYEAPQEFADEAALRGITVTQLCALIIQKDGESGQAILALEGRRQALKSQISAATGEHELRAIEGQMQ